MKRFSRTGSRAQYPLATIAAYGPNNTLATKLVVSVIERPGQPDPFAMQTWTSETIDPRHDPTIAADVARFVEEHGARQTVGANQIIGCPHEEGIDYPMGRTCPRCPFWADIDRFTYEPIMAPEPTLTPAEVLADLSSDDEADAPLEALESADGHRTALVEPLLRAIEGGLAHPTTASPDEASLFSYALYLLAKWREPRAYPYVVRWLSMPGEAPFDIAGDIVTQDGARILAAVCDGDLEPIKSLIVDRRANEYGRDAAVTALALLAAWAEVPRNTILAVFQWLAREGLEREPSQAWVGLACACADIEAVELFPELRRAYADGLIDPMAVHASELDEVEAEPRGRTLDKTRDRWPPIDDVVEATAWWSRVEDEDAGMPQEPYRAPPKVGRNEPCPCGSGKKFKTCCLV
ncbi:MAG: DUF1186 domain-containing protein [Acidobacteriota bacterium]